MFKIKYIFWPSVFDKKKKAGAHLFCFYTRGTLGGIHGIITHDLFCQDSAGSCPSVSQVTRAAKKMASQVRNWPKDHVLRDSFFKDVY